MQPDVHGTMDGRGPELSRMEKESLIPAWVSLLPDNKHSVNSGFTRWLSWVHVITNLNFPTTRTITSRDCIINDFVP